MEWSDIRVFLAVVRSRSLGEAARSLGVSHPTVGRRVKALEDEAEQPLFRRTKDGLVLTDAGDAVVSLAESMEASALAMERRLAGSQDRLEGILRISSADWFAAHVLAPSLAELVRQHPGVVPEIIASYRLLDLSRREADVAFRIVPFSEPDIVQRRLMTMPYGLYGSEATVRAVTDDPRSAKLILMNAAQAHFPDVTWLIETFPKSTPAFSSTSRSVQAQMCARGVGVAVLPRP
ncbi:MAG: LysR family transcriptional regulator, partial [Stenotrophomonas sp.]